ncbi:ATP-binding cassette domain-containing protein [Halobacteriovorax sp. YZS-1-1]|uniref:ATP-binding cassette domain-containing protein n=1 Tax=unclassified Halobacteriovorax TaxID=2639665 RepID=UPI003999A2BA
MISSNRIKTSVAYKYIKNLHENKVPYDKALISAVSENEIQAMNYPKGFLKSVARYIYFGLNETSLMSSEEQDSIREKLKTQDYLSRYYFLNAHYGLRKSQIHVLVGESGKGKSTLLRSIMLDSARFSNILVLLSEEDSDTFKYQMNEFAKSDVFTKKASESLQKIKVLSELDNEFDPIRNFSHYFAQIRHFIQSYNIKSLFYDNISTGLFSEEFALQANVLKEFKKIAIDFNIPVFIISHPKKGALFSELLLKKDHISGNRCMSTIPENIYTLNACHNLFPKKTYILIDKSRHYSRANNKWFELEYTYLNDETGAFTSDKPVTYENVIENVKNNRK